MRIVSGRLKGRALVAPEGQGTRPTSDRARQAIFNILEHAAWAEPLGGARVIDLYAGTGALGFEAISRGAVTSFPYICITCCRQGTSAIHFRINAALSAAGTKPG